MQTCIITATSVESKPWYNYKYIYNPLINFHAILLAVLGHVVTNRRTGIREYIPFTSIFALRFFSGLKVADRVNKVSLFSVFIILITSNGSSRNKLVLYIPVTLKF